MNTRRMTVIAVIAGLMTAITGLLIFGIAAHGHTSTKASVEHHGMSPAIWVAIFTPLWIVTMTTAARRRKDVQKRGDEDLT